MRATITSCEANLAMSYATLQKHGLHTTTDGKNLFARFLIRSTLFVCKKQAKGREEIYFDDLGDISSKFRILHVNEVLFYKGHSSDCSAWHVYLIGKRKIGNTFSKKSLEVGVAVYIRSCFSSPQHVIGCYSPVVGLFISSAAKICILANCFLN